MAFLLKNGLMATWPFWPFVRTTPSATRSLPPTAPAYAGASSTVRPTPWGATRWCSALRTISQGSRSTATSASAAASPRRRGCNLPSSKQLLRLLKARNKMSSQRMASHGNAPAPTAHVVNLWHGNDTKVSGWRGAALRLLRGCSEVALMFL